MKRWLMAIGVIGILAGSAFAHLTTYRPSAAIEYTGGTFNKNASTGVLKDLVRGDTTYWFNSSVTSLSTIIGHAHIGQSGLTQTQANQRVSLIQIWGWRDTDGDGKATVNDARYGRRTTRWVLLSELHPSANGGDGSGGDVVGYDVVSSHDTSEWDDILQIGTEGVAIPLEKGESWLLLIRVIDTAGNSNLEDSVGGTEQWENGDTSDGIGSDVPSRKYLDEDGNTPGTSDGRIDDDDIVWIYVPRT